MQETVGASFRDPMNMVYRSEGLIYRKINSIGFADYDFLIQSGLYEALVAKGLLISHQEISRTEEALVIQPSMIPVISYPYEWCFSQYKDAALLTIEIQKIAIEFGMSLKDASAYNVQFYKGKPIFIDTMSFEKLPSNKPWVAYRQFCQHFVAPLALMTHCDLRLQELMVTNIDGIPLDLAAKLLPLKSKFSPGIFFHLHLHAKFQNKCSDSTKNKRSDASLSVFKLKALIDSLESTIKKLQLKKVNTEWGDYYTFTNYTDEAFEDKKQIIESFLDEMKPGNLTDLGCNDGSFTCLAAARGIPCVAADIDPNAIENGYLRNKKNKETLMLPLVMDLANPSPSIGWHNHERDSMMTRLQGDCVMALALIHHLSISNNLPFSIVADFFADLSTNLIIEFVPKSDSMVQKLLMSREDIFPDYTIEQFKQSFLQRFEIIKMEKIKGSERILFWMKKVS